MNEHIAALPHYWMTGYLYATAGVMAAASQLGWNIILRNLPQPESTCPGARPLA